MENQNEWEKYYVHTGMRERGGDFVKFLGMALMKADPWNTQKIKDAFPEYWDEYREIGKTFHERRTKFMEDRQK